MNWEQARALEKRYTMFPVMINDKYDNCVAKINKRVFKDYSEAVEYAEKNKL